MMTLQVYVDYDVVANDLKNSGELCKALDMFSKISDAIKITVLSHNGTESDEMNVAFNHNVVLGDFNTIKSIPKINKNISYISDKEDNLKEWDELRGKSILSSSKPVETYGPLNKFYEKDSAENILKSLRKYIHI